MTPAAILGKALSAYDIAGWRRIARDAGVPYEAVLRASAGAHGQPTRANYYLRICAVIGIDPLDGKPFKSYPPADVHAASLACAVKMWRILKLQGVVAAAKTIGISRKVLWRIERGEAVSFESMLAVCRYGGRHPLDYVSRDLTGYRFQPEREAA